MGWIGNSGELYNALSVAGCDQDNGKFHVDGSITSFLGLGEEFVVGDDAVYYVSGKPISLVGLLGATSYGSKVVVI